MGMIEKKKVAYKAFKVYCDDNKVVMQDLAESLNVTPATLRNYLSGGTRMNDDIIVRIAIILNASVFELFPENPLIKHISGKFKINVVKSESP